MSRYIRILLSLPVPEVQDTRLQRDTRKEPFPELASRSQAGARMIIITFSKLLLLFHVPLLSFFFLFWFAFLPSLNSLLCLVVCFC